MILMLVLLSGVVDFVIERKTNRAAGLTSSIYEYFAGFLWGGFEYPLSKASMIYQVLLGFIVLVFISAYTANLAAYITVGAIPALSADSLDGLNLDGKPLCVAAGGWEAKFKSLHPLMSYEVRDR